MKKWGNLIRIICFILCLGFLFGVIQKRFLMEDRRIYQTVQGFYQEPENSLDAVYIGNSSVYAFWESPLAWNDFGYAIYPLTISDMPIHAVKYMVEECRKTQPDALYIININNYRKETFDEYVMHYITDWMPFSLNKINMITDLSDVCGAEGLEQLEYYFPIIRYHSNWSNLTTQDFDFAMNGLKGAVSYNNFLTNAKDISANYRTTEDREALTEEMQEVMEDLLDYLDRESVNALFVAAPQIIKAEKTLKQRNVLADMIEERGYPYVDLLAATEEIGINLSTDYYNTLHTNIHGAVKCTYYLAQYLDEQYEFTDKRNDPDYASWNEAYELYLDIISEHVLDFEIGHAERDYELAAPELNECGGTGGDIVLTWEAAEAAEGYLIYRKAKEVETKESSAWTCIAEVSQDILSYEDRGLEDAVKYTYTVVPVRKEAGSVIYGNYDMDGISKTVNLEE